MLVCCDIDGTASAAPNEILAILTALRASSNHVTMLTGVSDAVVTQADFDEKVAFLTSLGLGECWDDMTVLANHPGVNLADEKAKFCVDNGCDVLIDNAKANARAASAAGIPLCLVPWASRV